jgi:hypothetical protein
MRRGINIRKKKRIIAKETNSKALKLISILLILIFICSLSYIFFLRNYFSNKNFEEYNLLIANSNSSIPFSLNKIVLYSSSTASTVNSYNDNSVQALDISQYCDISLYINNENNSIIKKLYIDNISISNPEIGTPYLYKKAFSDMEKCSYDSSKIITNQFQYNIVSKDLPINYENYELYSDGSTPITIGFFNENIKSNYLLTEEEIKNSSSFLKDAHIPLSSINCNISFVLNIITAKDEHYICNINISIPFENKDGSSIYNTGFVINEIQNDKLSKFIKITP